MYFMNEFSENICSMITAFFYSKLTEQPEVSIFGNFALGPILKEKTQVSDNHLRWSKCK